MDTRDFNFVRLNIRLQYNDMVKFLNDRVEIDEDDKCKSLKLYTKDVDFLSKSLNLLSEAICNLMEAKTEGEDSIKMQDVSKQFILQETVF